MSAETTARFTSFAEFYPFYLAEHSNRTCRRLHFLGSTLALVCLAMLLAALLQAPIWSQMLLLALGLGVVNYQCLVPLQRVMAPMIARDSARRGRRGTNWKFESMYGRTGIIGANLLVIALVVYVLMRNGHL